MDEHFYRLKIVVGGDATFTSHKDETRIIERAMRRLDLPISFTRGFSPKPKISFGPARPTGFGSLSDLVEICLLREVEPKFLKKSLNDVLPDGFFVLDVRKIGKEEFGNLNEVIEEALTAILIEDSFNVATVLENLNNHIRPFGEFNYDANLNSYFLHILREAISSGKIEEKEEGVFIYFTPLDKAKSVARIDKYLLNADIKESIRNAIKRFYLLEFRLKR